MGGDELLAVLEPELLLEQDNACCGLAAEAQVSNWVVGDWVAR